MSTVTMKPMVGSDETTRDRLVLTFELFEFGVELMAANLRRRHPGASAERIDELLETWLAKGPEHDERFMRSGLARFR